MKQVGAQHTFALETDLLRNALGGAVVRIGDQLESLQLKVFEPVLTDETKGSRGHTATSRFTGTPVADVTRARAVDSHPDRSDDASTFSDRQLLAVARDLSPDEGARVFVRIGTRDEGNPPLNVGVVACGD